MSLQIAHGGCTGGDSLFDVVVSNGIADAAYKEEILPNAVRRRVAVEMGATQNWYKYVGLDGAVLGIDTFGASAPAPKVLAEYGFTVKNLVKVVQNLK